MYRIIRTEIIRSDKKLTDTKEVTVDNLESYRNELKELYQCGKVLFVFETIE